MTTTGPVFDPARSAALRDILHETVATAPARPSRTRFALVGGLVGAAVLLAGGTAALALTGALHFGAPDPVPVPITPTPSITPTPTPTTTPTAPRIRVQSGPIARHDVDTLADRTRWSIDLPGIDDGCRMNPQAYSVADGLSVFVSGARPKEYEGGGACTENTDERVGLTMVDTTDGEVLWQREWSYTSDRDGGFAGTRFQLLGTSGRAMFTSTDGTSGAHDVIDLNTGQTLATYDARALLYGVAVPDDSGDLVVSSDPTRGTPGTISRVDPMDASAPRWTTPVDGTGPVVAPGTSDASVLPAYYYLANDPNTRVFGTIDLASGAFTRHPEFTDYRLTSSLVTLWAAGAANGSSDVTALDGSGTAVWTRHVAPGAALVPVSTVASPAGAGQTDLAQAGQFAIADAAGVTVIDQLSGDTVWTSAPGACSASIGRGVVSALADTARNAFTLQLGDSTGCAIDRTTGKALPDLGVPASPLDSLGPKNTYATSWETRVGTAYDRATGRVLWTVDLDSREYWDFAGGYLVRLHGNRIASIG